MKAKKIMDETTNRYEYNRVRKRYFEGQREIDCSWCRYHLGDNLDHKLYGDYGNHRDDRLRIPNWKLVSKNKKQWMKKPIFFKKKEYRFGIYIKIVW